MGNSQELLDKGFDLILLYTPKLALAILTLIFGLFLIRGVSKFLVLSMEKSKIDKTLVPFINNLASWCLKALLFISVASMIGIETTSFVAVLGAAGLAVGLALQGSLSNFAGGVLIIIFKPYRVNDLIETQGSLGVVKEVQIFNTILLSPDNKRIIVPNGAISNGSVVNYSIEGKLRVDLVVGIAYESDVSRAKELLFDVMKDYSKVLDEPKPFVAVSELADSSVNLVVRPWCKPEDYWDVYFLITEKAKEVLETNGISIPFPQRDVHIFDSKKNN